MQKSRFAEAQIAFVLRQAEEGVSVATFYNRRSAGPIYGPREWKKKYAGLMPSEMRRLKQPEEENGNLKRLVAYLSLDKAMLQDVLKRKL